LNEKAKRRPLKVDANVLVLSLVKPVKESIKTHCYLYFNPITWLCHLKTVILFKCL